MTLDQASQWLQAISSLATAAALFVFIGQWRAMRRQVEAATEERREQGRAEHGRNALEMMNFLERTEHVQARRTVTSLERVPYQRWSRRQRRAADTVARLWQVAAYFDRSGFLPPEFLSQQFGGAIVRHWRILEPLVIDIRTRTRTPWQRIDFERLAKELIATNRHADWARTEEVMD